MKSKLQMLAGRVATLGARRLPTAATAQRIRGSAWMAIRDRILRRDKGICQPCNREGRLTLATEVDHRAALFQGGHNGDDNLEAICIECHRVKTVTERGQTPKRKTGVDGWPE